MGEIDNVHTKIVDAFSGLEKFLVLFNYNGERSFQCSPLVSCREQQFLFVPSTKTRYRLWTGTIQLRGRWWQRKTKTRNGTSGVYYLFPTPKLLYLIYFWQMGFRWLSIQFYRDSSETFPNPSNHRTRKIFSIGYFSLMHNLINMPQVKGGFPFVNHQWDQRTVNHQTPYNPSFPPEFCLAFSLCLNDHCFSAGPDF